MGCSGQAVIEVVSSSSGDAGESGDNAGYGMYPANKVIVTISYVYITGTVNCNTRRLVQCCGRCLAAIASCGGRSTRLPRSASQCSGRSSVRIGGARLVRREHPTGLRGSFATSATVEIVTSRY